MRKLKSLLVAIMAFAMVMAMSSVALAADQYKVDTNNQQGTATVIFTRNCSESNNDGQRWDGLSEIGEYLIPGLEKTTVTFDELNGMVKGYVPANTDNYFGNKVSVFDAIYYLGQDNKKVVTLDCGWGDAYTDSETGITKPAGAYVNNINNQELESDYFVEDGTAYSIGTGFVVAVQKAGETTPTFSDIYLSNVALEDGMTIYVDLGYYDYSWADNSNK